ncbi:HAUS augmin-like complex subunit 6 [Lampris incognitus]|uniref:HAUS augmin-like complex subunit 6 n=1 Tax=Lampris incognitus TaxID=2546036 RepID=UPI0024B5F6AB|nr:HAUS augmin-like complex subunit 6 [Lampris incognitus]
MAKPAAIQKTHGKYLWYALLGLGFQPDTVTSVLIGKANVKRINLGINMFDKPNKDAFYIVIHFLLKKLNPTRFQEQYRHCWPVLDHKADAEFRKVTCSWLRDIMEENGSGGCKVVASLFLAPGGHKFVQLMFHLAKHVMLQEMKTFSTDGIWVPEAAATPASSLDMALKRNKLVKARFLKHAVEQDQLLQEYQRRAQALVKSVRNIRAEGAKIDDLKCSKVDSPQEGASLAEKLQRVRSLWSDIDEMLSAVKEDQRVVNCVMKGDADQSTLDGADMVLKIPRALLERIEQLPQHLSTGNMYEAGNLNLLCVLELMNHALQLLREERTQVGTHTPQSQLSSQQLQEKSQRMSHTLASLRLMRQRISLEEIPEVMSSIRKLESEWDRKWKKIQQETPLVSVLNEDPALGFLSPMAPLCFGPGAEAAYRSSVFSQYPAKLLERPEETESDQGVGTIYSELKRNSFCTSPVEMPGTPIAATESLRANSSLHELFETPPSSAVTAASPPKPHQASVRKVTRAHPKMKAVKNTTEILDLEYDNLANQFADAVTSASPLDYSVKDLELEDLLSTLGGDPFSARKQLPRTPESLIKDVKSYWRKAVEEDVGQKPRQSVKFSGNSILEYFTPLDKVQEDPLSPGSSCQSDSCAAATTPPPSSPPVHHQGSSFLSTLSWDSSNMEALHSLRGMGSSTVHFSQEQDQETLPEMPGNDSLLSLIDEAPDTSSTSEEEALLLLEARQTPLAARLHIELVQKACREVSVMDNVTKSPECLLSRQEVAGLDIDQFTSATKKPAKAATTADKVFSLDLDTLESPLPPNKEYSLPKLITFSPIDDL